MLEFLAQMEPATIAEAGAVAGLVIVLYAIIDKVLVPLVRSRSSGNDNRSSRQEYVNKNTERRLAAIERDLHEVRDAWQTIGTQIAVLEEILKRIEGSIK